MSFFTRKLWPELFRPRPYAPLPPALDPTVAAMRTAFPGVRAATDAQIDAMIAEMVEMRRGAGIARWIEQREAVRAGTARRGTDGRFLKGVRHGRTD